MFVLDLLLFAQRVNSNGNPARTRNRQTFPESLKPSDFLRNH